MSYLTDYEEIDGDYIAFEGNPKGEKITGKASIINYFCPRSSCINSNMSSSNSNSIKMTFNPNKTGLLWSLLVFIRIIVIWERVHDFQLGIIYKNSKKEKRVMHGYMTPSLSKEDAECLRLFEEEIKERLKHRDQMRRWEIYVNGRMMDYVLWEIITNGATLPRTQVMDGVTTMLPITTAREKAQRRLEVKARSTLMMGIPNEHQLKFYSIKDVKQLLKAVEKRFELLGEKLSQKDVNQKLLRSLSPEWNAHAMVWRNKTDPKTMGMDDIYNNLKVYEPEVKWMSSLNSKTQNMSFVSSSNNSSTNGVVNNAQVVNNANRVSTTSTQVNTTFSSNIENLSDAVICVCLASQLNSPHLAHKDLEQIHPDDIEEMGLRWQIEMLTMRAKRFLMKIRRKLTVNGNETLGFDMYKVECYSYRKRGHFAKECRALRNQDTKHKESTRRSVLVETPASTTLASCDDFKKSELMVYKTGLKSVEERLEFSKKNEFIYLEDIRVLKVEIQMKKIAIKELRRKLEVAQNEKNGIQLKLDKFENASKSLDKLIECQIVDNYKKSFGYESYNAVLPLYTGGFMPPKPDLSFTGLDEFANKPEVENKHIKSSEVETKAVKKNVDPPIIEE
nr:hypothetical protein [Tanacetum cinerariifolium]